jgi:pimeloyl-ACP methyl ester carboxylesterase
MAAFYRAVFGGLAQRTLAIMAAMPVRIDDDFLAMHASHVSEGVEERAYLFDSGGERCFGLLHLPTAGPQDTGYAVCHSYGDEFQNLRRTERAVARALASRGFPVLRFDRRGFGDSDGSLAEATLERQLGDVRAALSHLARATGVTHLGLAGARFGGLVAGLVAREGDTDRLILMNPAVRGGQYLNQLIKQTRITQLSTAGAPPRSLRDLMDELDATGMVNVIAHPLHRHLYGAVQHVDLSADMGGFHGEALVTHSTKGSGVPEPLEALRRAIEASGGTCRVELVEEPRGVAFGQASVASSSDPVAREYLYEPMDLRIAEIVRAWVGR